MGVRVQVLTELVRMEVDLMLRFSGQTVDMERTIAISWCIADPLACVP